MVVDNTLDFGVNSRYTKTIFIDYYNNKYVVVYSHKIHGYNSLLFHLEILMRNRIQQSSNSNSGIVQSFKNTMTNY